MSLFKFLYNPGGAMVDIRARSPYFIGAALALLCSFLFYGVLDGSFWLIATAASDGAGAPGELLIVHLISGLGGRVPAIVFLAAVFVPACLLAANLIDRRASFGVLLRQEYAPLASCVLYAWAAAHLAMVIPALFLIAVGIVTTEGGAALVSLLPLLYFVVLATIAVRVVLQTSYGRAIGAMSMAALSLVALPLLPRLVFLLTSPFFLILLIILLRNFFGDVMASQRGREELKRNLEFATLNPADASAQYNLGLIYQRQGQNEEAKERFLAAIQIDADEVDAHYQLGRIARAEGRFADAITHFDAVVGRKPDHSQNEVWREIGRTYLDAGQHEDARSALERFLEKRPSDAEGRYHLGLCLHHLGRAAEAAGEMQAVIESVRSSPAYKYRAEKQWLRLAESFLRTSPGG
jgi:tetratricopeptide (TPR) repeat protein